MNYSDPHQPGNPTEQPAESRPNPFYGIYKGVFCFIFAYFVFGLWIIFLARVVESIFIVIEIVTKYRNYSKLLQRFLVQRSATQLVLFIVITLLDANGKYMGATKQ